MSEHPILVAQRQSLRKAPVEMPRHGEGAPGVGALGPVCDDRASGRGDGAPGRGEWVPGVGAHSTVSDDRASGRGDGAPDDIVVSGCGGGAPLVIARGTACDDGALRWRGDAAPVDDGASV